MSPEEPVARFLETASRALAGTSQAEGLDMMTMQVLALIPQGAKVFCPEQTDMERAIAQLLPNRTTSYNEAAVTVEEAQAAIAETGTVVCASSAGKALPASLLPSHHIALVARQKVFTDLDAFFAAQSSTPPTNITLITGPSRTADIELSLVVGVHGPERLDVIVV